MSTNELQVKAETKSSAVQESSINGQTDKQSDLKLISAEDLTVVSFNGLTGEIVIQGPCPLLLTGKVELAEFESTPLSQIPEDELAKELNPNEDEDLEV